MLCSPYGLARLYILRWFTLIATLIAFTWILWLTSIGVISIGIPAVGLWGFYIISVICTLSFSHEKEKLYTYAEGILYSMMPTGFFQFQDVTLWTYVSRRCMYSLAIGTSTLQSVSRFAFFHSLAFA